MIFQLEESSISRHIGERKIRVAEDDELSVADTIATESELTEVTLSDHELDDSDDEDDIKDDKHSENCDMVKKEDSGDTKSDLDSNASTESDNNQRANISESAKNIENQDGIKIESVVSETDIKINVSGDKGNETEIKTDPDSKEKAKDQTVEFPDTEISLQHVQGDR